TTGKNGCRKAVHPTRRRLFFWYGGEIPNGSGIGRILFVPTFQSSRLIRKRPGAPAGITLRLMDLPCERTITKAAKHVSSSRASTKMHRFSIQAPAAPRLRLPVAGLGTF